MRIHLLSAGIALVLSPFAIAQEPGAAKQPFTIGSDAPKPVIEKFVRGTEPAWNQPGKTYVVEFWATWCGPCRASMPHISELQEKYGDKLVVVGISDEKVEKVTSFLDTDEWKQKARYTLATDPDRSVYNDYMVAAGQNGIPTAFVVKDGKVQWIGHPMSIDGPLEQVVAGTWDMAAARDEFEKEAAAERKQMERRKAMSAARKNGDWAAIMKMADEDIASATGRQKQAMQVQKFKMMLGPAKMAKEGYAFGRQLADAGKDNAQLLNELAWFVVDDGSVAERDIPFALETAKAAVAASKSEEPAIIDTLARAYWESGDKSKAVEWQRKAVDLAGDDMADELKETLKKYESGDAPAPAKKTAWRADGDAPKPADAPKGNAPAAKPGEAPGTGAAPTVRPRAPRMPAKLSPSAEKVFPEVTPEGFDSPEAIVKFAPDADKDAASLMRLVRGMRATTDDAKTSMRIASALIADMTPMAEATIAKFGKAVNSPVAVPVQGTTFEVKMEGEDAALLISKDDKGQPMGQPRALVKADGKWWFDFDKATNMRPGEGAQMAMMANMMGDGLRMAMKNAATATGKRVMAGEFKTSEEAQAAFAQAMQQEMMGLMGGGPAGPGGPGGPGIGGRMGGPGAGAPGQAPAGQAPAAPTPPAAPAGTGAPGSAP
jgi:thiol-disulfide isomerase/thioredoxin